MKTHFIIFVFLLSILKGGYSQNLTKQANTTGSEICVDAPYHLQKYDSLGNINSIPLHVFVHGSSCIGCNNELMNVRIKVKNASQNTYNDLILFDDITEAEFQSLFINKSETETDLGIQSFDASLPAQSDVYSIDFTSHSHSLPATTYTDITDDYWWFTMMIPGEKLVGYENVIDFEVYCELDWDPDQVFYLRVFRQVDDFPVVENWFRGDVHYHGMFTQNSAEVGLPIDATKIMAKYCGLDWITFTDHSCDFDNYGIDMFDNWEKLGINVQNLNQQDSSLILIRAIELTVKNSANDHIHTLVYPRVGNPLNMPYFGDGDGDISATDVTVDKMCDSLILHNCFAYAAHPFAEGDELSFAVDGSVWNLGHSEFPENGMPHDYMGSIICNDLSNPSDLFSDNPNLLLKDGIVGGEIWNLYASLKTTEAEDPWDTRYAIDDAFSAYPPDDEVHTTYRFMQNLEAVDFIWQKGLQAKNQNENIQNWKFFISAGSDAHGSFNFSTTDLFMGVSGQVTDNAIGKLSSLVYCPIGMGVNGKNVLKALKNGRVILSSGPVFGFSLDTDAGNLYPEIIVGTDTIIQLSNCENITLDCFAANSSEYGDIVRKQLIFKTQDSDFIYDLPNNTELYQTDLLSVLNSVFTSQEYYTDTWILIRGEMETLLNGLDEEIHHVESKSFYSYTNPVWIKIVSDSNVDKYFNDVARVYPNPAHGIVYAGYFGNFDNAELFVTDLLGKIVFSHNIKRFEQLSLNMSKGVYLFKITDESGVYKSKIFVY
ncbi:MAG: T9SS type A sorting domain-containing protein [Bacteroidales bacterium]|nr:T9SS type A sorting domain-containing protein [Bacteroidales bacterium]